MKFKRNSSGQSLIEYMLIVAIVAIGSIGIVKALGHTIYIRYANVTNRLQNNPNQPEADAVNPNDYKKRDLDDFFKKTE